MRVRFLSDGNEHSEVLPRVHRKIEHHHIANVDLPLPDIAHTFTSIPTCSLPDEGVGQLIEPDLAIDSTFVRTSPCITVYTSDELVNCARVWHRDATSRAPFETRPIVHA